MFLRIMLWNDESNVLLFHAKDSQMLEKFVIDKCADSVHLALQVYWFLEAAVEDARRVANTVR